MYTCSNEGCAGAFMCRMIAPILPHADSVTWFNGCKYLTIEQSRVILKWYSMFVVKRGYNSLVSMLRAEKEFLAEWSSTYSFSPAVPACNSLTVCQIYTTYTHTHTHTHTHVYKKDSKHMPALYNVRGLWVQEWVVGDSYTRWQLQLWIGCWLICGDHNQRCSGIARVYFVKCVMTGPFMVQTYCLNANSVDWRMVATALI